MFDGGDWCLPSSSAREVLAELRNVASTECNFAAFFSSTRSATRSAWWVRCFLRHLEIRRCASFERRFLPPCEDLWLTFGD